MPHVKDAFDLIDRLTPNWAVFQPRTMLYVGWRHDCHPWWHRTLAPALGIEKVTLLEVFPPNVSDAEEKIWNGYFKVPTNVIQGNILEPTRYFNKGEFDVIYWDHGPEHVTKAQFDVITPILQNMRNKLLLYSCPWGDWPQGAEGKNEHERHLWSVDVKDMQDLGMSVYTVGKPGQQNLGEIVAIG